MLDVVASKPCTKKKVIDRRKRSKVLKEIKPVGNIIKNPASFLEISSVQKEVPPSQEYE